MAASGATSLRGRMPVLAKYEVLEEIGHGGMATVYRAHDPRLGRDVAAKVIHPHLRDSLEAKQRFYVEAKAVAKLRHPNIVEVFDVSSEGEPEQYLVVELVRGSTLRRVLADRGPAPPEVAAALGVELLAALAHAHAAGVVHRDIKPENVMLEHRQAPAPRRREGGEGVIESAPHQSGDRVRVKLTDFGIAKLLDAQGVTSTGQVLGSPAHMAPEQIEGGDVDGRADIFGLGVLLYECMVGHLPFEGKNPAQVLRRVLEGAYPSAEHEQPKVGKRWSAILDRALARTPEDRFPDALAMQAVLLEELKLLGVESSRAELEAWFDDPDTYAARRDPALIARLCELGRASRSEGRTLEAAAHFNRALAYSPHDAALLKIVSTIHRARTSRALALRILPVVIVSIVLGTTAFYVTRVFKPHPAPAASVAALGGGIPSASDSASPVPSSVPSASASARPRSIAAPLPPQPRTVKPVERTVVLGPTRPPFGVLFALDGVAQGEAHEGLTLTLDGRAHDLRFTCMKDECEPLLRNVPPGDEPIGPIAVSMTIKPARIVVDGDMNLVYGIEEFPSVSVRVAVPVPVPVPHGNYAVHVIERTSGRRVSCRLDPGREVHCPISGAGTSAQGQGASDPSPP
jgi:serine/threonine protein kinase